jgi:hypothetical protein
MKTENPFYLKGYFGPDTFCNRRAETQLLTENMQNGRNTLLLSVRRMGKTGLILHTFNQINSQHPTPCLYVDLFSTQNLQGFINQFAGALLACFPEKHSMGSKITQWLKSLRPTISYDPLTGTPEVSIAYATPQQAENSISGLFNFLEQIGQPIIVAFDEFQQIRQYPEKNTEALLRTYIQHLKNVQFIFSGSNKHLMFDIFNDSRQPFFASTSPIVLTEINADEYHIFIEKMFTAYKRSITPEAIRFILEWTRCHTYYTQALSNKVFAAYKKNSDLALVHQCCYDLLAEHEPIFYQYRQMLTPIQWALLKAIAIEGQVNKPHAKEFLQNHRVGTSANVQRALEALLKNEMLYRVDSENGSVYRVYNVFLSRWLERK